jgi:hypothetical protein
MVYMAVSSALSMFWSPGRRSEICRFLEGLKTPYDAISGRHVLGAICLGGCEGTIHVITIFRWKF